jgi:hypothetical protein
VSGSCRSANFQRSPENNVCRVAPFLFSQYIARMLWRVRNLRGRPMNAPAAFIHPCQPIVAGRVIDAIYLLPPFSLQFAMSLALAPLLQ